MAKKKTTGNIIGILENNGNYFFKTVKDPCGATRVRQEAVLALKDKPIDVLLVVGDPTSNNTEQLAAIGRMAGIPAVMKAETVNDLIDCDWNEKRIAITSGASTPKYLTSQIIDFVKTGRTAPFSIEDVIS